MGVLRELVGLPVRSGPEGVAELLPHLRAALDGTGPALLPLPQDESAAARIRSELRPGSEPVEDDVAVVIATSGSTGAPKGVLLTADALRASAAATEERLGGPAQWTLALPLSTIAGLQVLVRSELAGTTPVALAGRFTAEGFADATAKLSAPRLHTALVPTQLVRLLDSPLGVEALRAYDAVLIGGAAAAPALLARAVGAGARTLTTYGMTETCGGCVYDGVPLRDVDVRLTSEGRIALSGPVLFRGYHLRPDLTSEAVRDGELLTHDIGVLREDGSLEVVGRVDDVVISGGVNVALGAVESVLTGHPGVAEAAVVGVPDDEWGTRIVGLIRPTDHTSHAEALRQELRSHVAEQLGGAAAPRDLLVVEALPRLESGKLDRLAAQHLARHAPAGSN